MALASAGGSLLGLLNLGLVHPGLVDGAAFDDLAEKLLRMFGMPAAAARIARRPLPDVPGVTRP